MSFASGLHSTLDAARSIAGELGLRVYSVFVRVTTWSGARVGLGIATVTTTPLLTSSGHPYKVQQLSQRDIVASGGRYSEEDLRIGPMTPVFDGGGVAPSTLDPVPTSLPTEVRYVITGPGLAAESELYEKIGQTMHSALHYDIVVHKTGRA